MNFVKLLLLLTVTAISVQAKEYKALFDCSSGNFAYIKSRMWLVDKTMDMMEKNGDSTSVVLTLHGKCVPIVSEAYDEVVDDKDIADTKEAQKWLIALSKRNNVKIIACSMSLQSNDIDEDDVLPFVNISDNSFIETIIYQNEGYAFMAFK